MRFVFVIKDTNLLSIDGRKSVIWFDLAVHQPGELGSVTQNCRRDQSRKGCFDHSDRSR